MIALETTNLSTHVTYVANFTNEDQAVAFIDRKAATSVFTLDESISYLDLPKVFAKLFPSCEHGLSVDLCEGPNHYPEGM